MADMGDTPDAGSLAVGVFLAELASASPAPGGGAAAALAGALAAALVAMVARVTVAREASAAGAVADAIGVADRVRETLTRLMTEDTAAYRRVVQSRLSDSATRVQALRAATEVPLSICRHSGDVLALCAAVAPGARASAISDLGVAAALAWGALESGACTVRGNLKAFTDAEFVRASDAALRTLLSEGERARQRVTQVVAERIG